ncbi:MAG: hypothetical protein IJQ64_10790, partial [Prevotella sp.]|nr:hypothetical protein [Prevotella sp.]
MKKLLLISLFAGVLPLSMTAQVDDLYFVPKKKSVEKVTDHYGMPKDVYYSGSNRSIDEYNRRAISHYELIGADSIMNDTINFIAEKGVYPDSVATEDFALTKKMSRFDDYDVTDNAAFWAGYEAGRYDWGWHSPWYYSRFGWYDYWYDPWYYRWYDPYYYSWYGGWYGSWYGSWYSPWHYSWYGYPWYNLGYYGWVGSGGRYHYTPTIGAGSIRRDGMTYGSRNSSIARNSSRMNELRNRTVSGNSRNGGRSRNSNGYRNNYNNSSFNGSRSNSNSSFSGSRSSSGGGSFSSGGSRSSSGGGSFSSGGSRS